MNNEELHQFRKEIDANIQNAKLDLNKIFLECQIHRNFKEEK